MGTGRCLTNYFLHVPYSNDAWALVFEFFKDKVGHL
ncbi:uncharacterized protein METZ01_LOCUS443178, partial [marine metagenome]